MIKAMNTINLTGYPIFTPNQVLTKDDLNNLVNYLDEQNRLTRVQLIGMGIVCGLEVQTTSTSEDKIEISITAGCGITSEGFCIQKEKEELFTHYLDNIPLAKNLFIPSESPEENYVVTELLTKEEANKHKEAETKQKEVETKLKELTKLNENELKSHVLIILYDWQDLVREDYCQFTYDDRGQERSFRLRFLLLPTSQNLQTSKDVLSAERLLRQGYQMDKLPEPWKKFATQNITQEIFEARNHFLHELDLDSKQFKDFAPQVQRFGCVADDNRVDLTSINDYKKFRENYYLICQSAIDAITNAFPKLFWLFSPFFTAFQPNSGDEFSQLKDDLENLFKGIKLENILAYINLNREIQTLKPEHIQPTYTLQYFYDYLSLLVAAFYELAEAAFDLMDDCTPDTQRFPRFLMLGLVPSPSQGTEVYAAPSAYRSHFTQPPIYNSNQLRVKQVRYLYQRLLNLCAKDSFYVLPFYKTPLKITPSKDQSTPLSEQAIPYYLNPKLYQYWNYDAYRKGRSDYHPAYFYPKKKDAGKRPHEFKELTYRLDGYNFYRIEGHIGKANADILESIQKYQQRYNLAFDVITLKLARQPSLQNLKLYGQFDDLELDFELRKKEFQKIYDKYAPEPNATEPKNVLLQMLKKVFFEEPSLTAINYNQLFNPILEIAQKPENYKFLPVEGNNSENTRRFKLSLQDYSNQDIARYVTQNINTEGNNLNHYNDLIIDFSGLSNDDAIEREKQRIINNMADCLTRSKITYGIVVDVNDSSNNQVKYYLKLSTEDVVNLPSSSPENSQYSLTLLSSNYFTVSIDNNNYPEIKQSEFLDFETLYSLLRDVPKEFDTKDYKIGNKDIADELNGFVSELIEPYQQRLEQLMKLHLFHKFAQQHPGMEHLGGVPKGGTFILVYVDGEEVDEILAADKNEDIYKSRTSRTEDIQKSADFPPAAPQELISSREELLQELKSRKDVIVGDFCLPYRLPRIRPVILLKKTIFCEGDRNKYQFILQPEGGIVRGEGVLFEGHRQLFQPSRINQASQDKLKQGQKVVITFTYAVDDIYDILTVTIYPRPDANFTIGGSEENKTSFCANDESVTLTPNLTGGTFQVLDKEGNVLENVIQGHQFDPSKVELGEGKTEKVVNIKHTITSDKGCTNVLQQQVTIFALPDAGFQVGSEGNKTSFCANDDPVTLTPNQVGDKFQSQFQALDNQGNALENAIEENQFVPTAIQLGEGEIQKVITIKHTITSKQGCINSEEQQVTIFALPDAAFRLGSEGNTTSFCANDRPVALTPNLAGGTFQALDEEGNTLENAIEENQFTPSAVKLGEGETEKVIIIKHTITSDQACTNAVQQRVTIFALPDAAFRLGSEGNTTSFCANDEPVALTPNLTGGTFQALDEQGNTLENAIEENQFIPSAVKLGEGKTQKLITINHTISSDKGCINSEEQEVMIFALPDASFQVGSEINKTHFCANDEPVNLIPNQGGGSFRVFAGEEDISTDVLNSQSNPPQFLPSRVQMGDAKQVALTVEHTITSENNCTNQSLYNLTVHQIPVGDFQAEIANIYDNGFSIRVFDIQPVQETSLSFNWEHLGGNRDTTNPGNNEFIINYDYDFNNWIAGAEVSITLQVNTPSTLGGCSSEPLTKHIPIPFGGVQGFNLLTINNERVINRVSLEADNTFNLSDFSQDNQYAIEAVTVPETVDELVFNYTAPHVREEESSLSNTPYRLPNGWQPIIGVHRIKAQVFRELNGDRLEGISSTVVIRVNEDGNNGENGADTPTQPISRSFTLLNRFRVLFEPDSKDMAESQIFN